MIISNAFGYFVLISFAIRGEDSCKWMKSTDDIAVDPSTCKMERSMETNSIFHCLDECDQKPEVRPSSLF